MRFTRPGDQDDRVQIIDLGAATYQQPPAVQDRARSPFLRRRLILGAAMGIGLLSGQVLLAAPADTQEPTESASALPAVSACEVIEPLRISSTATSTTDTPDAAGTAESAMTLPTGYTVLGVIDTPAGDFVGVGLIHPDGLVEVCEHTGDLEAHRVVFSGQSELGALPEGMSYAYRQPAGWTSDGLVLRVAGVRLADGTVVEHLTLPDGRVIPKTVTTN